MSREIASHPVACGVLLMVASTAWGQQAATSHTYFLLSNSTYQQGCFAPCACPAGPIYPIAGTFALKFTGYDGLYNHYAVNNVYWTVRSSPPLTITGSGSYRVGGEFAVQQQMSLDLVVDSRPQEHFDSGLVSGGGTFPAIDVIISIHGIYCHDTVITMHARLLGDLNADGTVNMVDVEILCAVLNGQDSSRDHLAAADMNQDGAIDGRDIQAFVDALLAA